MPVKPLISILTPSYNQGRFIEETILSIKNQEYSNFEHIIADGGSTDLTLDFLKKYENTYPMHWISEPDKGQADALNKCFQASRGDIIGWLNTDDLYEDGAFEKVVDYFINHPEVNIVYGNCTIIDEEGKIIQKNMGTYTREKLINFWEGYYGFNQPSIFYRRAVFDRIGLFDTNLHYVMDYDFLLRAGEFFEFGYVDADLSRFRVHGSSKGASGWEKFVEESIPVINRYWKKRNWLKFLYYFFILKSYYAGIIMDQTQTDYFSNNKVPSITLLIKILSNNPFLVFNQGYQRIILHKFIRAGSKGN